MKNSLSISLLKVTLQISLGAQLLAAQQFLNSTRLSTTIAAQLVKSITA